MILTRSPFVVYDVDALAVALIAALAVGGWLGMIEPQRQAAASQTALRKTVAQADGLLSSARQRLEQVGADMAALEAGVSDRLAEVPRGVRTTRFMTEITTAAANCGVRIAELRPRPSEQHPAYNANDIELVGSAPGAALLAFCERLYARNPYFSIEKLTIHRELSKEGDCRFSILLRFFTLRDGAFSKPAGGEGRP